MLPPREIGDLYRRIAGVTTRFEFTHPVSAEDVATVLAAGQEVVPEHPWWIYEGPPGFVTIEVGPIDCPHYGRQMIIAGYPGGSHFRYPVTAEHMREARARREACR